MRVHPDDIQDLVAEVYKEVLAKNLLDRYGKDTLGNNIPPEQAVQFTRWLWRAAWNIVTAYRNNKQPFCEELFNHSILSPLDLELSISKQDRVKKFILYLKKQKKSTPTTVSIVQLILQGCRLCDITQKLGMDRPTVYRHWNLIKISALKFSLR
jgi:hypothetical protein